MSIVKITNSFEIAQNHPVPGRITKNHRNAQAPAIDDLNVCFQFFTILNKIDRLTFTTRKAQFV